MKPAPGGDSHIALHELDRRSGLLLVCATLAVSCAPIFINLCDIPYAATAAGRLLGTAAIMAPFAWAKRHDFAGLSFRAYLRLGIAGVCFGAHFLLFMAAFDYTSFESAVILLAAQPIIAAVLGWLVLKERPSPGILVTTVIAIVGLGVLVGQDFLEDQRNFDSRHLYGDMLVVLAGFAIVIAIILGRGLRQRISAPVYTSSVFLVAGCTCALWAWLMGQSMAGDGPEDWVWLACLILVPTIAGHGLFNYLVKHVSVFFMNFVILVEPVISTGIKWLLDDPRHFGAVDVSLAKVIGAAILIGGVAAGLMLGQRARRP